MPYKFKYSESAEKSINNCVDYLLYEVGGTGSIQAARHFVQDLNNAVNLVSDFPYGFPSCEIQALPDERKIHFRHLKYKLIYHVEKDTIVADLVVHDLQDYQKLF